jgi:protein-disulfide isomerase
MDPNRRNMLIGAAALAVIAAAGAAFYFTRASINMALLMTAGPLGEMAQGDPKAPVTVIEYASMTCPHCANFHATTYPELKTRYIDTGKVRFVFREFPLDQLAAAAFMLARCAGPDKYFPTIERLFQRQEDWVVEQPLQPLMAIARESGLSEQSARECLQNTSIQDGIEEVRLRAIKLGVESTPSFFINGVPLQGDATIEELAKQMTPYLKAS